MKSSLKVYEEVLHTQSICFHQLWIPRIHLPFVVNSKVLRQQSTLLALKESHLSTSFFTLDCANTTNICWTKLSYV